MNVYIFVLVHMYLLVCHCVYTRLTRHIFVTHPPSHGPCKCVTYIRPARQMWFWQPAGGELPEQQRTEKWWRWCGGGSVVVVWWWWWWQQRRWVGAEKTHSCHCSLVATAQIMVVVAVCCVEYSTNATRTHVGDTFDPRSQLHGHVVLSRRAHGSAHASQMYLLHTYLVYYVLYMYTYNVYRCVILLSLRVTVYVCVWVCIYMCKHKCVCVCVHTWMHICLRFPIHFINENKNAIFHRSLVPSACHQNHLLCIFTYYICLFIYWKHGELMIENICI